MANIVHKMIISVTDDGKINMAGIPDRLDTALALVGEINKAIVNYFITEMKRGNVELTEQSRIVKPGIVGPAMLRKH